MASPDADADYAVFVEQSWLCNRAISEKNAENFTVTFDKPASGKASLDWMLVRWSRLYAPPTTILPPFSLARRDARRHIPLANHILQFDCINIANIPSQMKDVPRRKRPRIRFVEWQSLFLPLLCTVIGFFAPRFLSSNAVDQKLEVLLSLVGFLVGGFFSLLQRLYTLEDHLQLEREVHRHEYLSRKLHAISHRFKEVEGNGSLSPALEDEAERVLDECVERLGELVDGTFPIVDYVERMGRLTKHVRSAESIIRATSYVSSHWWTSAPGRQYAQFNYDAVARKCSVERVFILTQAEIDSLERPASFTSGIRDVMDEQSAKGIKIFVALDSVVEDPARGIPFSNLLICDEIFATHNKDTPDGTRQNGFTPMPAIFVYDPEKVGKYIAMFDALKCCSSEYSPKPTKEAHDAS